MAIRINGDNTAAAPGITRGDDTDTGIQFGTDEISLVTGGTEKVKVDSSGNIGVGVSPSDWGGSRNAIQFDSAGAAYLCNDSTMGIASNFYFDGSANKYLNSAGATALYVQNNDIRFDIAAAGTAGDSIGSFGTRVHIDSDGLKFNGDTAAANALNDYEEGTWTPDFLGRTSAAPNIQNGVYRKIGKQVFAYFHLNVNTTLTCSVSALRVNGFPFNPTASGNVYGTASSIHFNNSFNIASTEAFLNGLMPPGGNYLSIYYASGSGMYELPVSRYGTGNVLACAVYFVD